MAKRGYKLQEFVAHSGSVNCLSIGKKSSRLFVTGGDDQRVNLWSIGKSTSLTNFRGHTSGVESVAFDTPEVLVVSGASNGVIKLWDLEETKLVRSFNGHVSSCTAVEFHPFGEFFASGSMDTKLQIWDIRKKESIHTYEGHTKGISTIRFTPDGRWVVSGGFDNVVKIWDLTAGKLLHDFKFHVGHITSLDFHPLEFLLATGSADRTVKFWDLETFELIGTSRPEATGVRSMTFHPDGRTLFCGLDDSLKVYSWEPVICHDTVDLGWSTLADLCVRDGKLSGCSYYQNSVGIWISDIALIEPYEASSVPKTRHDLLKESRLTRVASHGSSQSLRCISPDDDTKEIKNIYVDTSGEKPSNLRRSMSSNSLKAVKPSDSKEINNKSATHKRSPSINLHAKAIGQSLNKSFMGPNVVSRDSHQSKDLAKSRRESITKGNTGISLNPAHHVRRSTATTKLDVEKLSRTVDSLSFDYLKSDLSSPNVGDSRESSKGKLSNVTSVADKLAKVSPPSSQDNCVESVDSSKGMKAVKYVNGVAVVEGRTRSLVERFEKREKLNIDEAQKPVTTPHIIQEPDKASSPIPVKDIHTQVVEKESTARNEDEVTEDLMQNHDLILSTLRSRLTKLQVVRLFWERNDIKGGINAMQTLPDHSVQADVVSVLVEKMDIFTLDLFSCLLPVLFRLLDSKIDRHINVSLELLLKLVAVFGPSIRSTVSAPPSIGVDLHAEQRRECCNKCFILLEDVQKMLPTLVRRGGIVAKCALELNLVLQQS